MDGGAGAIGEGFFDLIVRAQFFSRRRPGRSFALHGRVWEPTLHELCVAPLGFAFAGQPRRLSLHELGSCIPGVYNL